MLIAAIQTDVQFSDVPANVRHVLALIEQLGQRRVELAVFPECVLTGYGFDDRESAFKIAIDINGPEIQQITHGLARHSIAITLGTLVTDGRRLTNSALLMNRTGVIGRYDKVHLPHLGVDRFVDRGEEPYRVHEIASGCRVGMAICYDCSFPEPMRALGLEGADVIALGTNWPVAAARTAEIVPPARSMENHLYFVAANRIGHERGFDYCGLSSICGPDGIELARAQGAEATILIAEIDLDQARNKTIQRTPGKHVIDRFADRQPTFYGSLSEPNQLTASDKSRHR